jgi:hypothetical protein
MKIPIINYTFTVHGDLIKAFLGPLKALCAAFVGSIYLCMPKQIPYRGKAGI